ncbi:MAG TPA: hypothetical protein VK190_02980 [Pseudoneobacillus sp.]|nr:hypothetical protein [Pseudoneobacillus sp.]
MEQPISSSNESITQGPAKSREFNTMINDIHKDIENLFDISNSNNDAIRDALTIYAYENYYLQRQVNTLKTSVDNAMLMINNISNNDNIKSLFNPLNSINNINATQEFNTVTLPAGNKINKLAVVSGDETYIPESLVIEISECTDGISYDTKLDTTTDFIKGLYWTRSFRAPSGSNIQKVYSKIHITVPMDISNNIYANVLKIIPYPRYGVSIDQIRYKNRTGNWNNISYNGTINIFNDADVYELEVYLSQSEYFTDGNDVVFTYGLKELELYYYDFLNTGSFVVPFSIANMTRVCFDSIKTPDDINGISYQLFTDPGLTREIWFDGDILEDNREVYLKVNLEKKDSIPVMRGITLNFYVRSAN